MVPPETIEAAVRVLSDEVRVDNGAVPPLTRLTEATIRNHITALFDGPGNEGYSRLMQAYQVRMALQRLRLWVQPGAATDPRVLRQLEQDGAMQTFYEYIPNTVVYHLREMQEYQRLRAALGVAPDVELERLALAHVNDLSGAVALRRLLGRYGQLITLCKDIRAREPGSPLIAVLNRKIGELKEAIRTRFADGASPHTPAGKLRIRTPAARAATAARPAGSVNVGTETHVPVTSFINADTDNAHYAALGQSNALLDLEISWIMSMSPGVPGRPGPADLGERLHDAGADLGVVGPREVALPSEALTMDLLERALRDNVEQSRKVAAASTPRNGPETERQLALLRTQRQRIVTETVSLLRRMGRNKLDNVRLLGTRHALDMMVAEGPRVAPMAGASNPEMVKYLEQELQAQIKGIRAQMGEMIADGNILTRQIPEAFEDLFNGTGRQAALQVMEALIVVRQTPRRLARSIPGARAVGRVPVVGPALGLDDPAEDRAELMRRIRVRLGYPEGYDPLKTEAENAAAGVRLTDADKARIRDRLKSTLDTLKKFRPKFEEHKRKMDGNFDALTALRTAAQPDSLLGTEPADAATLAPHLVDGRVTTETVRRIAALPNGAAKNRLLMAAYIKLFEQMYGDWDAYVNDIGEYLNELEDVLNMHIEMASELTSLSNALAISLTAAGTVLFLWWVGGRGGLVITRGWGVPATFLRGARIPFGVGEGGGLIRRGLRTVFYRGPQRVLNGFPSLLDRARALFGGGRSMGSRLIGAFWDPAADLLTRNRVDINRIVSRIAGIEAEMAANRALATPDPAVNARLMAERTALGNQLRTILDKATPAERMAVARRLLGNDFIRRLNPEQLRRLTDAIMEVHDIGRGLRLTDTIEYGGRRMPVRNAKWLRLQELTGELFGPTEQHLMRRLMDGVCGQTPPTRLVPTGSVNWAAELGPTLAREGELISQAVRAGRITNAEAGALRIMLRNGTLPRAQAQILARAGAELTEAEAQALGAAARTSRVGTLLRAGTHALAWAGGVFELYSAGRNIVEGIEAQERVTAAMRALGARLEARNFRATGERDENGIALSYRHEYTGTVVNVRKMKDQVAFLEATRTAGNLAGNAIGLAGFAWYLAGGPFGVVVAIAGVLLQVTVMLVVNAWTEEQRIRFLIDMPEFLPFIWDSSQAFGMTTAGMISNLYDPAWLRSLFGRESHATRRAIEKKLVAQLFTQEFNNYAPEVIGMVMQGNANHPMGFEDFFNAPDGFTRIYEYWLEECSAITGKTLYADKDDNREDAFKDQTIIRRAIRYAVARHLRARHVEQRELRGKEMKELQERLAKLIARHPLPQQEIIELEAEYDLLRRTHEVLGQNDVDPGTLEGGWRDSRRTRLQLYRAAFKDPITCNRLLDEFPEFQSEEDDQVLRSNYGLYSAVLTTQLTRHDLPHDNFRLAQSMLFTRRGARLGRQLMPSSASPELASRMLTEEAGHLVGSYSHFAPPVQLQSQDFFPDVRDRLERPVVLASFGTGMSGAETNLTASYFRSMCDLSDDYPGLLSPEALKAVAFTVRPITVPRWREVRNSRSLLEPGPHWDQVEFHETHYVISARYFYQADGQTIVAEKGLYLYQNARSIGRNAPNTTAWRVQRGSVALRHMDEFLGPPHAPNTENRALDAAVSLRLNTRRTEVAVARSNRRNALSTAPADRPPRPRRMAELDSIYDRKQYRPTVMVSADESFTFRPDSPEYELASAIAVPPNLRREDDPHLVVFEFERQGNTITALATYVSTGHVVRRRAATATVVRRPYQRNGQDIERLDGVVHEGETLHDLPIAEAHVLQYLAFNAPDENGREPERLRDPAEADALDAEGLVNAGVRIAKARNAERIAEAIACVNGELPAGRFVQAGQEPDGRLRYLMYLPGADVGRDAYVLRTIRVTASTGPSQRARVRIDGVMRDVTIRFPDPEQLDSFLFHSRGAKPDEERSLSNVNEFMTRMHLTFFTRDKVMEAAAGSLEADPPAAGARLTISTFLGMYPEETRPPPGVAALAGGAAAVVLPQESARDALIARVLPLYEAAPSAEAKRAILLALGERIRTMSSAVILFANIDRLCQDLDRASPPRETYDRLLDRRDRLVQTGPREYATRFGGLAADNLMIVTEGSPRRMQRGDGARFDFQEEWQFRPTRLIRHYGSTEMVVRGPGFVAYWNDATYFRGRDAAGTEEQQWKQMIFDRVLTARGSSDTPNGPEFYRSMLWILNAFGYDSSCFEGYESSAEDGRVPFANIIGRLYRETPAAQRTEFLRELFTILETRGGERATITGDWRTDQVVDISRELEGAVLCPTFRSIIMQLRRRFPISDEQRDAEMLHRRRADRRTMTETGALPYVDRALWTSSTVGAGAYMVFVRPRRTEGDRTYAAAIRYVPVARPPLQRWDDAEAKTIAADAPALVAGVAGPSQSFAIRILDNQSVNTLATLPDIRLLKNGTTLRIGTRNVGPLNANSITTYLEHLSLPLEKDVGRLYNLQPLRDILQLCSGDNAAGGTDRRLELYRGISEHYWRATNQGAFLRELVNILAGIENLPGGQNVGGVLNAANVPLVIAHFAGRYPIPAAAFGPDGRSPELMREGSVPRLEADLKALTALARAPSPNAEEIRKRIAAINAYLPDMAYPSGRAFSNYFTAGVVLNGNSGVIVSNPTRTDGALSFLTTAELGTALRATWDALPEIRDLPELQTRIDTELNPRLALMRTINPSYNALGAGPVRLTHLSYNLVFTSSYRIEIQARP